MNFGQRSKRLFASTIAFCVLILGCPGGMSGQRDRVPTGGRDDRPAPRYVLRTNVLDSPNFRRPPIPFQKYEMVHPKTGKPLNPAATVKLPNGNSITIKQFYDELNKVEQNLSQRGYSLRNKAAFVNRRINFNPGLMPHGPALPPNGLRLTTRDFQVRKNEMQKTVFAATRGGVGSAGFIIAPNLYVLEYNENIETKEFPDKWVKDSHGSVGRKKFPFLVEAFPSSEQNIKKFIWQVSSEPFTSGGDMLNPPGLVKTGEAPAVWNFAPYLLNNISDKNKKFASFYIDFSTIAPIPVKVAVPYYVRVISVDGAGKRLSTSGYVTANYGAWPTDPIEIFTQDSKTLDAATGAPLENKDSPFNFYFRKSSLKGTTAKKSKAGVGSVTLGYKVSTEATAGVRYFNLVSLVDPAAAKYSEIDVSGIKFEAVVGLGTGPNYVNETQGARIVFTGMGEEFVVPLTQQQDVRSGKLQWKDSKEKVIDKKLAEVVIPFGPLNIKVDAYLKGKLGYETEGIIIVQDLRMNGFARMYISSTFSASGSLEAPLGLAYVKVTANLDPLLNTDMNFAFNTDQSEPLSFIGNYNALNGNVDLSAGFYHPCPPVEQVEQLWGYITGDEDMPLCETSWHYEAFKFGGVNDSWQLKK